MRELARHYTTDLYNYQDDCSQSDCSVVDVACAQEELEPCPPLKVVSPCSSPESPSLLTPDLSYGCRSNSMMR